jgi:hypothetical protein
VADGEGEEHEGEGESEEYEEYAFNATGGQEGGQAEKHEGVGWYTQKKLNWCATRRRERRQRVELKI